MKSSTLLGFILVAALAGAVYVARHQSAGSAKPTAGPAMGPSAVPSRVSIPSDDEAIPDVTSADASVVDGDVTITLSVSPRPPVAFHRKTFRVQVQSAQGVVGMGDARIRFEMRMPMGDHRYSLVGAADGWQEATVVLPFCSSGNPRWFAIVEGTVASRPVTAVFRVDLTKGR